MSSESPSASSRRCTTSTTDAKVATPSVGTMAPIV
jgi:hypothetical protein